MSRVCALMEPAELDWLRARIADIPLCYFWEDCELSVTNDPDLPSVYVHPDILPFVLLWRPLAVPENEYALSRALCHTHSAAEGTTDSCFIIRNRAESWRIPYDEIYYFEARDKKNLFRTAEQELPFYETMARLEKPPDHFLRCHKGYLVNQKHIERVDWANRIIQIRQKICIPLSRSYGNGVKEKVSGTY